MRRVVIDMPTVSAAPKLRSPAQRDRDVRRAQRHHAAVAETERARTVAEADRAVEARLVERSQAWADGGRDEYTVARQDGVPAPVKGDDAYRHRETPDSLAGLHVERRAAISKETR